MAQVTGSRGAPMNNDPRVEEILREAENNPGLLQQLLSRLGTGGGGETQTQSSRLTGDLGLTPMSTGPITTGTGSAGAVGNVAGVSSRITGYNENATRSGTPITGGGGGGFSVTGSGGRTLEGGGGSGGGGGGRPPITGASADAPLPSRGGESSITPMGAAKGASAGGGGGGGRTPTATTGDGGKGFQNLLNIKGVTGLVNNNRGMLGTAARYAGAGRAIEEAGQGNVLGAVGSGVGMFAAGRAMQGLAAGIPAVGLPGMLAKGALYATGSLLGSNLGADLLTGAGKMAGGIIPGVQGLLGNAAANTAARGESAGPIPGLPGIGAKKVGDMNVNETIDFMRRAGMNQVDIAKALNPMLNQNLDQQRNRQMQLNQQNAQLTGGLNQQRYMAELAGGAQTEAGALTRQVITSVNPYANSAFQYR
jgi:hypothetical protein